MAKLLVADRSRQPAAIAGACVGPCQDGGAEPAIETQALCIKPLELHRALPITAVAPIEMLAVALLVQPCRVSLTCEQSPAQQDAADPVAEKEIFTRRMARRALSRWGDRGTRLRNMSSQSQRIRLLCQQRCSRPLGPPRNPGASPATEAAGANQLAA